MVEPPSTMVVRRAEVVIADAPPAPATPKMVVDPIVEVITDPAESVMVVKSAEVVMAEDPTVTVSVPVGDVTKAVSVFVVAPPRNCQLNLDAYAQIFSYQLRMKHQTQQMMQLMKHQFLRHLLYQHSCSTQDRS